jgi:hypothetical protein
MEDLELNKNAFTGPLPASWGSFSKLTTLWLSTNKLQGSIPASWGALGAVPITTLVLKENAGLVGCLPRGLERFQGNTSVCQGTGLKCSVC